MPKESGTKVNKISKIDIAYIAGFFDGEGSICTINFCRPSISICQKFPNVLYHIHRIIKLGRVRKHNHIHPSPTYYLTITNQEQIKSFISLILPYAVIKKKQLEVGMKLTNLRKDSGIHLIKKEQILRQLLCNKLKELKRQDYEP